MKRTLVLLTALMVVSVVYAQNRPDHMRPGRMDASENFQNPIDRLTKRLSLTEDQVEKIEALRLAHMKATQDTKNELEVKHAQLDAAIESQNQDQKKIDQLVTDINKLRGTLFEAKIEHRLAMRATLTEDQQLKFDQMKDHRHGGAHQMGRGK